MMTLILPGFSKKNRVWIEECKTALLEKGIEAQVQN